MVVNMALFPPALLWMMLQCSHDRRAEEAASISTSITSLNAVIQMLAEGKKAVQVPYEESTLSHLFKVSVTLSLLPDFPCPRAVFSSASL